MSDIDVELLEPLLRQMVDLIGLDATMVMVEACGGTMLNIARQADQNEFLVGLVGAQKAGILGRALGPDRLLIPKALPALKQLRNQQLGAMLKTHSVRQAARHFGLGERQTWYIKRRLAEPAQDLTRDLFE